MSLRKKQQKITKLLKLKLHYIFLHLSLYSYTSRKFRSMSYLIFVLFCQELIIVV